MWRVLDENKKPVRDGTEALLRATLSDMMWALVPRDNNGQFDEPFIVDIRTIGQGQIQVKFKGSFKTTYYVEWVDG